MERSMAAPIVALDVSTMGERYHTGIANVTKNLAIEILGDHSVSPLFFYNRTSIPASMVEKFVTLTRGDLLSWIAGRVPGGSEPKFDAKRAAVGIYPAHKWHRRYFPLEVQIVHDLTTVLTPQFHTDETVKFWHQKLLGDMASSELIVAVSKSTEDDIRTYYPQLSHIPIVAIANGLRATSKETAINRGDVEPYVVVLGTLEPRKNIEFILRSINANPRLAEKATFVFVGRFGWGRATLEIIQKYNLEPLINRKRIRFTGFVSDQVRDDLLRHARLVIYPSLYEGFGLPILEAFAHGVPVLTTFNSSLPEVGGELAMYCDPSNLEQFARHLWEALEKPHDEELAARLREHAAQFSWPKSYGAIKKAVLTIFDARVEAV
jgi:glycosyltransferase involved in cell wall biosynthesis